MLCLSIGKIYSYTVGNSKALEMYEKAQNIFEKAEEPLGIGIAYQNKGRIYYLIGDSLKALEMYEHAIPLIEKGGDILELGNIYKNKGNVYAAVGGYSKAHDMYEKALPLFKKVEDPLGQGGIYLRRGVIYLFEEKYSMALAMLDKALPFFDKTADSIGQGNVYFNKGNVYLNNNDYLRAKEMYDKALSLYEKGRDILGQGLVYTGMGDTFFYSGENFKALRMYEKAMPLFTKDGALEDMSYTCLRKARVFAKQGKKKEAIILFEEAISILEKVRTQVAFSVLKMAYIRKVYKKYEETVSFMLENNYHKKAFKYAELMKARVFLDQLVEGLVRLDKGIKPEFLKKRDDFVSILSALSKQITETASKKDKKKLIALKEERRKVESQLDDMLIKIRLENPLYGSVRYPQPVFLKTLRKKVLKKGELMLRYFTTEEKTYVFLVSKKKFKVLPLNITSKGIQRLANRYLLSMKNKYKDKLNEYGTKLYQSLFKPLELSLKGKKNLIIIPDGQLATIPFESFITSKNETNKPVYLLEKYKIKYIQSASVLSTLRKHYKRTSKTKHFIGFGDPVYDYENFKKGLPEQGSTNPVKGDEIKEIHRGKYDREGGLMNRLQGSGQEVQAIAGLFKKDNQKAVIHLRDNATEEMAKSLDLKDYDYIHFSCHGILGDGFQSLVLSQAPKAKEDGYLTMNEIMNCHYNAKLVVLSACQTGKGKMDRGEGVTGLTRAVIYAGTPAVVASLWNVSDIGTKELMVQFYKNILEKGMSKEDALREAKLSLLRGRKYSSPCYWSSFVMYGE
jgi:CHAT domain-containing protein/Tfp pilus assembly protein PilF